MIHESEETFYRGAKDLRFLQSLDGFLGKTVRLGIYRCCHHYSATPATAIALAAAAVVQGSVAGARNAFVDKLASMLQNCTLGEISGQLEFHNW